VLDSASGEGLAVGMVSRVFILCTLACLGGCSALPPGLRAPSETGQGYPQLVPLGTLIAESDALPLRSAEAEGQSLAARAADLRRRAALLRDMTL